MFSANKKGIKRPAHENKNPRVIDGTDQQFRAGSLPEHGVLNRLLLSAGEFAFVLGLAKCTVWRLHSSGKIPRLVMRRVKALLA